MTSFFKSRGVLLTLGITFVSLIVLSFAGLLLRNAENSDVRLTELSAVDRVYTLTSSLEHSIFRSYFPITGVNLSINNDTIILSKDTKNPQSPGYFAPPDFNDASIFTMKLSDTFIKYFAESVTYKTVTLDNPIGYALFNYLLLNFYYPAYSSDLYRTALIYAYTDNVINITKDYNLRHDASAPTSQYCCFELNNHTEFYPVNSTYQLLFFTNITDLREIKIKAIHPTRCPIINWSAAGTRRLNGVPAPGEINVKLTIVTDSLKDSPCLSSGPYSTLEIQTDAILNRSGVLFPQIIFLDNLTKDAGYDFITPYDPIIPPTPSLERPTILFYDPEILNEAAVVTNGAGSNELYVIQYDNPIQWEITLKYAVGPLEVYSTETVTANLPGLNVSRVQRPARFK